MDAGIVKKTLYGGPCDGQEIEIHRDNLKIKPKINVSSDDGRNSVYAYDAATGKFIWTHDARCPKETGGWFVCDDDGDVISEEKSEEDAMDKLDDFNDDSEKWKFGKK